MTIGLKERDCVAVADATVDAWCRVSDSVMEMPISTLVDAPEFHDAPDAAMAVLVPDLHRCELVVDEDVPLGLLKPVAEMLSEEGWKVTVLVPSHRCGEAHHDLRGGRCRIQQYWLEGDLLRFGRPELP